MNQNHNYSPFSAIIYCLFGSTMTIELKPTINIYQQYTWKPSFHDTNIIYSTLCLMLIVLFWKTWDEKTTKQYGLVHWLVMYHRSCLVSVWIMMIYGWLGVSFQHILIGLKVFTQRVAAPPDLLALQPLSILTSWTTANIHDQSISQSICSHIQPYIEKLLAGMYKLQ